MQSAYKALEPLDEVQRLRAVQWLAGVLGVEAGTTPDPTPNPDPKHGTSQDRERSGQQTPKDFMVEKKPQSAVERVACLAFFLTHHRETPKFRTGDITALNTEAAAVKFGDAVRDVNNADRQSGFIVSAGGRQKQITARGEALVQALPDRERVGAALAEHPYARRKASTRKAAAKSAGG